MQVPLRITVRHMPQSPALEERIRDEVAKLENFNARIVSCYVTIEEIAAKYGISTALVTYRISITGATNLHRCSSYWPTMSDI